MKMKFRVSSVPGRMGTLYFQIIHKRVVKQIKTEYKIYTNEWRERTGDIAKRSPVSDKRTVELKIIRDKIQWEMHCLESVIHEYENSGASYQVEDVIKRYKENSLAKTSVFEFMRSQIERLKRLGKVRTGENYQVALNNLMKFRGGVDLYFETLDADMIEQYEGWMKAKPLSRNTSSFNMRILHSVFNKAVTARLVPESNPFKNVYTGIDRTSKRAITLSDIKRIKGLDLSDAPTLDFARDIFLFSFYMRGMSFIDIAYLRKKDLCNGYVVYNRKKTGQQLVVCWEKQMQNIVDKYGETGTQYLLPIIQREDGTENRQYKNKMLLLNRKLKKVAVRAKLQTPLTLYVARHSWASIAKAKNISIGIISEAMGHDSETTTQIYLASIQTNRIDDANRNILKGL